MSAPTLTEQQLESAIQTAEARRCTTVPHKWVAARLLVIIDARVPGIVQVAGPVAASRLAREIDGVPHGSVVWSVHNQTHAVQVFAEMRDQVAAEGRGELPLLSLRDAGAIDVAAEYLAAHPHGALLVTTAVVDGHALAARWS